MKALALSLLVVLCTVSCRAQTTVPEEGTDESVGEEGVVLEEILVQAKVDGTRFEWGPRLPVVPGRKARGITEFKVSASISGTEVKSIVLHEFETLDFKPGGGAGRGLGRWKRESEQYEVWVDDTRVNKIELENGHVKTVKLTQGGPGNDNRTMLTLTVKLLDAQRMTIAEFVDPWDIQP